MLLIEFAKLEICYKILKYML